eukprot:COSAG02_NODE_5513_length_4269_cov_16.956835_6_plen_520_part_00
MALCAVDASRVRMRHARAAPARLPARGDDPRGRSRPGLYIASGSASERDGTRKVHSVMHDRQRRRQRLCEPNGHELSLRCILLEVYNPRTLFAVKLQPTVVLRACKALAWLFNAAVGQVLCCWGPGESRVLDYVGRNTGALCRKLYNEDVGQDLVRAFLVRRFLFAFLTSSAAVLQIVLQLAGVPFYALLITCILAPVTLVDKQLATLITKMIPRYDRSQIEQLVWGLTRVLQNLYPDAPDPPRMRSAGAQQRCLNLTVVEMCVGGTQFLAGLLILVYSVMLLMDRGGSDIAGADHDGRMIPRYFDTGDGRCELGSLCVSTEIAIVAARCVKEVTNWLSAWIEWRLTPHKYSCNSELLHTALEAMAEHAGGIDQLVASVHRDRQTRRSLGAMVHTHLVAGAAPAPLRERQPVKAWDEDGLALTLPIHLRNMKLEESVLRVMELMCWCAERETSAPLSSPHGRVKASAAEPGEGKTPSPEDLDETNGSLYRQLFMEAEHGTEPATIAAEAAAAAAAARGR